MDSTRLRELQAPLKEKYRDDARCRGRHAEGARRPRRRRDRLQGRDRARPGRGRPASGDRRQRARSLLRRHAARSAGRLRRRHPEGGRDGDRFQAARRLGQRRGRSRFPRHARRRPRRRRSASAISGSASRSTPTNREDRRDSLLQADRAVLRRAADPAQFAEAGRGYPNGVRASIRLTSPGAAAYVPTRPESGRGGIGRRARFRSVFPKGSGGSTPLGRTTGSPTRNRSQGGFERRPRTQPRGAAITGSIAATFPTGSSSAQRSRSTPRRWGSTRIATGCASCSCRRGDGDAHLVQFAAGGYDAPNLRRLLADPTVTQAVPFRPLRSRDDLPLSRVMPQPLYCTKIASRLARTFTDRHGLRDLCKDLLNVDLTKQQQSSDWGARDADRGAAALCRLRRAASARAARPARRDAGARGARPSWRSAASSSCRTRVLLDLEGWAEQDIFAH